MKHHLLNNIWLFLFSILFLILLVITDFIWTNNYIKYCEIGIWIFNMFFYFRPKKPITVPMTAKQCDVCNLFVPLDINTSSSLKPHCCYMKPKGM